MTALASSHQPKIGRCARLPSGVEHQLLDKTLEGRKLLPLADRLPVGDACMGGLRPTVRTLLLCSTAVCCMKRCKLAALLTAVPHGWAPSTPEKAGTVFRDLLFLQNGSGLSSSHWRDQLRDRDSHAGEAGLRRSVVGVLAEDACQCVAESMPERRMALCLACLIGNQPGRVSVAGDGAALLGWL